MEDLHYLAGLIDGEGCVVAFMSSGRPQSRLTVTMTAEVVIDWLIATWGGTKRKCNNKSLKKVAYTWDLSDKESLLVLGPILAPLLKVKRYQLETLVELRKLAPSRGTNWTPDGLERAENLVQRIQSMNKR